MPCLELGKTFKSFQQLVLDTLSESKLPAFRSKRNERLLEEKKDESLHIYGQFCFGVQRRESSRCRILYNKYEHSFCANSYSEFKVLAFLYVFLLQI